MQGFRDLKVYQLAYKLAMEIFHETKKFPKDERYSLTDQIRRSTRSVAANIAEGFRKRQYPKMFASLLANWPTQTANQPRLKSGWILPAIVVISRRTGTQNS